MTGPSPRAHARRHPALRPPASRTARNTFVVEATQSVTICYSNLNSDITIISGVGGHAMKDACVGSVIAQVKSPQFAGKEEKRLPGKGAN